MSSPSGGKSISQIKHFSREMASSYCWGKCQSFFPPFLFFFLSPFVGRRRAALISEGGDSSREKRSEVEASDFFLPFCLRSNFPAAHLSLSSRRSQHHRRPIFSSSSSTTVL